ncbi:MAG: cbb3-type cytochrome c oxidase subunit 3 [Aquabacterium sp.]|jgi:cytochrome c oxidase cbb3-type subunit 4|nr:cbb3-type cytochrome c oxidase subunit 3 [Aquabacterium sp.]MBP7131573.1 cbb3-type cytochrome c oxidase subunit 3 [Aquabacterium sp.]
MDIIAARTIFTVVCLCVFVGIVAWAYSHRNKAQFEEAGRLPLAED